MADTVRYFLEQMVPELEDYEKRGMFSRQEIKEIVKKRSDFEYALKRRAPLKDDFLRYVEYEVQLNSLRKIRKAAIVRCMREANLRWRTSLSDRAITQRILVICDRAVRKFKGDLRLWLKYMELCRILGSSRRMQKVMMRALQLHPNTPGLWMYAAAWELEANLNEAAARALMQQGLRMCPKSESLWLEYLRLELTYARKIKARQLLLGSGKEEPSGLESAGSGGAIAKLDELCAKVTRAIFRSMVQALPDDVTLRLRFFTLLEQSDFAGKGDVIQEIVDSSVRDFPGNVDCCKLLAETYMKTSSAGDSREQGEEKAIEVFEKGLATKPSAVLYSAYAEFLEKLIRRERKCNSFEKGQGERQSPVDRVALKMVKKLKSVYERAKDEGMLTPDMANGEIVRLIEEGTSVTAQEEACSGSLGGCRDQGGLWMHRMALACQRHSVNAGQSEGDKEELFQILQDSLNTLTLAESLLLWKQLMEAVALEPEYVNKLVDFAGSRLALNGGGKGSAELECALATWAWSLRGPAEGRKVCSRLLALPRPTREVVRLCGKLEAQAGHCGDDEFLLQLRKAFEGGLAVHGATDTALWLDYCRLELLFGGHKEAADLHWRAKKTLKDPSTFFEEYQRLMA